MYLHIGENKVVRKKDIVAIFDMDSATVSSVTKKYLSNAQKEGKVKALGFDLPRTFIVMRDGTVYLSSYGYLKING
ncbi:MAG: DUF370 domain-containing protein [Clostridia bacterium]|nr:DUF370 domain-containing protein [Clostridia bacterium]MBO5440015.1 DUF370 domain-containing protein [Clostridia bacterium]